MIQNHDTPNSIAIPEKGDKDLSKMGRNQFLESTFKKLVIGALGSGSFMGLLFDGQVEAQNGTLESPLQALEFLLKMAYLQDQFYSPSKPYSFLTSDLTEYPIIQSIQNQEKAQIIFLQNAITSLGGTPSNEPPSGYYNFAALTSLTSGISSYPDYASFYPTFLAVAQLIEDTVNRAYLGQIPYLLGNTNLLNQISGLNSVHARHSAFIRQIRGNNPYMGNLIYQVTQSSSIPSVPLKPWVSQAGIIAAGNTIPNSSGLQYSVNTSVYTGEDITTQALISILNLNKVAAINENIATESFDEPLSYYSTLSILNSFIAPTV